MMAVVPRLAVTRAASEDIYVELSHSLLPPAVELVEPSVAALAF